MALVIQTARLRLTCLVDKDAARIAQQTYILVFKKKKLGDGIYGNVTGRSWVLTPA